MNKIEELASKLAGGAKAAKATWEGLTGVFRHLEKEHGEVSALLMRLKASHDPDVRRELFPTIRRELLAHERAEISEVYPVMQSDPQTADIASSHDRGAKGLDAAIDELTKVAVDSPHWPAALEDLIELVKEHVREEEHDYFPIAQRVFSDRADDLLERFEAAKARALQELRTTP